MCIGRLGCFRSMRSFCSSSRRRYGTSAAILEVCRLCYCSVEREADVVFQGQPYWDHSRYIDQPIESWPMFDGSDTSLSGNGQPDTPDKDCYCVTEGPFANWKVNLGPGEFLLGATGTTHPKTYDET